MGMEYIKVESSKNKLPSVYDQLDILEDRADKIDRPQIARGLEGAKKEISSIDDTVLEIGDILSNIPIAQDGVEKLRYVLEKLQKISERLY